MTRENGMWLVVREKVLRLYIRMGYVYTSVCANSIHQYPETSSSPAKDGRLAPEKLACDENLLPLGELTAAGRELLILMILWENERRGVS